MVIFIAGLALFLALHFYSAVRSRAPERDIKTRMGEGPYKGLYSLVSAVGLGLIIYGYWSTPAGALVYVTPLWTRHLVILLMWAALVLLTSAYTPPGFLNRGVRHPMVTAVAVWAAAHLLMPADLKELLLFGGFLLFGVVDLIAAHRRPFEGGAEGVSARNDLIALGIGTGVFAVLLLWGHQILFGIAPL